MYKKSYFVRTTTASKIVKNSIALIFPSINILTENVTFVIDNSMIPNQHADIGNFKNNPKLSFHSYISGERIRFFHIMKHITTSKLAIFHYLFPKYALFFRNMFTVFYISEIAKSLLIFSEISTIIIIRINLIEMLN